MSRKNRFSLSLAELLLFVTFIAVSFACLRNASAAIDDGVELWQLLTILISAVFIAQRASPQRSFWIGFLIVFLAASTSFRSYDNRSFEDGTEWLFHKAFQFEDIERHGGCFAVEPEQISNVSFPGVIVSRKTDDPEHAPKVDFQAFRSIAMIMLSQFLGLIAGWFARSWWMGDELQLAASTA